MNSMLALMTFLAATSCPPNDDDKTIWPIALFAAVSGWLHYQLQDVSQLAATLAPVLGVLLVAAKCLHELYKIRRTVIETPRPTYTSTPVPAVADAAGPAPRKPRAKRQTKAKKGRARGR